MTTICHLWDGECGWEQRVALNQLLSRSGGDVSHEIAALDSTGRKSLGAMDRTVHSVPHFNPWPMLASPWLNRFADERRIDVFHVRSARAAYVAASTNAACVVEMSDPRLAMKSARLYRTLAETGRCAFVGASGTVRRRWIEGGVPADRCVVIRPGVEFHPFTRANRERIRRALDIGPTDFVVTTPAPVDRAQGAFDAYCAAAMLHFNDQRLRMLLPGSTSETLRIRRFARSLNSNLTLLLAGGDISLDEALCAADVLIAAPREDVSTAPIARAMAANVAVIGAAVPAVAEIITHKVNGLLFKQVADRRPVPVLARLLGDRESLLRYREAARGQAYEVFSVRRYVDQFTRLYQNLTCGAPLEEGITDTARISG